MSKIFEMGFIAAVSGTLSLADVVKILVRKALTSHYKLRLSTPTGGTQTVSIRCQTCSGGARSSLGASV